MTFAKDLQIAGKGKSPCLPNSAFQHYKIEKKIFRSVLHHCLFPGSTTYSPGPYLGFFVCGGKLGFREISDQYSYKKQPSKIRHYVRKKTFSFPGGGNCPLRPPAMYGPVHNHRKLRKRAEYPLFFSRVVEVKVTFMCGQLAMED